MRATQTMTHDDLSLHKHAWTSSTAKADIVFLHGFFEHSGRYAKEAKFLNKAGYNFYAYDQRTHGRSDGKYRSYIKSFDNYLEDYKQVISELKLGSDRPYYLMSHSMGGLVMCSYLLGHLDLTTNFKGAVFSAPLILPDSNTAPLLQKMAGLVGTLLPRLKTIQIDPNHISRDPSEIKSYVNDPLNHTDKMYASSGYQLIKQMKRIQPKLSSFHHPFLILHGTADRLAEVRGSQLLYDKAASKDKELVLLEDYKHEILKDIDNDVVWSKIITWMDQRI